MSIHGDFSTKSLAIMTRDEVFFIKLQAVADKFSLIGIWVLFHTYQVNLVKRNVLAWRVWFTYGSDY